MRATRVHFAEVERPELDPEVARRINAVVESGGSLLELCGTQITDAQPATTS